MHRISLEAKQTSSIRRGYLYRIRQCFLRALGAKVSGEDFSKFCVVAGPGGITSRFWVAEIAKMLVRNSVGHETLSKRGLGKSLPP